MTIGFSITKPASIGTAINAADVNTPIAEIETLLEDIVNGVQQQEVIRFLEVAAPSAPSSGQYKMYWKSGASGQLYAVNSAGSEVLVFDFNAGAATLDILQIQIFG